MYLGDERHKKPDESGKIEDDCKMIIDRKNRGRKTKGNVTRITKCNSLYKTAIYFERKHGRSLHK